MAPINMTIVLDPFPSSVLYNTKIGMRVDILRSLISQDGPKTGETAIRRFML